MFISVCLNYWISAITERGGGVRGNKAETSKYGQGGGGQLVISTRELIDLPRPNFSTSE